MEQEILDKLAGFTNDVTTQIDTFQQELEAFKGRVDELPDWNKHKSELTSMRNALEQFTRQLPSLGSRSSDRGDYNGVFPSADMARDFGALCLSIISPRPDTRERAAQIVAKGNYRLRTEEGKFVSGETFVKDMGISTDTGGGYLTPDEMVGTLIRNIETFGVARKYLTVAPMGRSTQFWPKRTGGLKVYYPDEGKPPTASDLTLGLIRLTAKKWAVFTPLSREVDEDSLVALGDFVALEMALAIAQAEDANCFMGDGGPDFGGIVGVFNSDNVTKVTMDAGDTSFDKIAPKFLTRLITATPTWAKTRTADPAYYMSPEIFGLIMELEDASGRPIYRTNQTEGFEFKINGYPVREIHAAPGIGDSDVSKSFIAFGSLRLWGILGQRRSFAIRRSSEVLFLQDQIAIMAVPRQDIQEADGEAMTLLQTAAV